MWTLQHDWPVYRSPLPSRKNRRDFFIEFFFLRGGGRLYTAPKQRQAVDVKRGKICRRPLTSNNIGSCWPTMSVSSVCTGLESFLWVDTRLTIAFAHWNLLLLLSLTTKTFIEQMRRRDAYAANKFTSSDVNKKRNKWKQMQISVFNLITKL